MDLGRMLADALEAEGLSPPTGSGTAAQSLQAAAESFLAKVREAEEAEADSAGQGLAPPFTMDS